MSVVCTGKFSRIMECKSKQPTTNVPIRIVAIHEFREILLK